MLGQRKKGLVSFDEYESLDEINGLMIAGEISLQRLQRTTELRIDSDIAAKNVSDVSETLLNLRKEEQELSAQLFENQKRHSEMIQLKDSIDQ